MARWDDLFADMEGRWRAQQQQALEADIAEAVRLERSRIALDDRLRAQCGEMISLQLRSGMSLSGQLGRIGADWLSLTGSGHSMLVPLAAITWVDGLPPWAQQESGHSRRALSIASPLRALMRDRARIEVFVAGQCVATGLLATVGKDHVDVRLGVDAPQVRRRTVPLEAVELLRSH